MLVKDSLIPNILIVENEIDYCKVFKMRMEEYNYEITIANDLDSAIQFLEMQSIHCIVLDLVIDEKKTRRQYDGIEIFEILKTKPFMIPVIVTTDKGNTEIFNFFLENYKKNFIAWCDKNKSQHWNELPRQISNAIENNTGINWNLEIELKEGLTINGLTEGLERVKVTNCEMIELIGKSFSDYKRIDLLPLAPGLSGTGVLKAIPYVTGGAPYLQPGEMLVLKFGEQTKINTEYNNYMKFVKNLVKGNRRIDLNDGPSFTGELGAIQYTFFGAGEANVNSFKEYYCKQYNKIEIAQVLKDLFEVTFSRWYHPTEVKLLCLSDEYQAPELKNDIKKWAEKNLKYLLEKPMIKFDEINNRRFTNPLNYFDELGKSEKMLDIATIHGDLNGSNILIDNKNFETRLIDFYQTRRGYLLDDFAKLETVLKFELLEIFNLEILYELENCLNGPKSLTEPINYPPNQFPKKIEELIDTIIEIRKYAADYHKTGTDITPYYLTLFYKTAKALTYKQIDNEKRRYILLSLCMLGDLINDASVMTM